MDMKFEQIKVMDQFFFQSEFSTPNLPFRYYSNRRRRRRVFKCAKKRASECLIELRRAQESLKKRRGPERT